MWDMTHPYVRHDSVMGETWLTGTNAFACLIHEHFALEVYILEAPAFICETWLIHMRDMTLSFILVRSDSWALCPWSSYVRNDSVICETWLIHMWDMTHSCIRETWLIHMWDMTHSYVRHDSFIHVSAIWFMSTLPLKLIYSKHLCEILFMCDMTHI